MATSAARVSHRHALPLPPTHVVERRELLRRLLTASPRLVCIVAPAGFGKTTLLRQWSDRVHDAAYLRLDAADDDASVLLRHVAQAISMLVALDEERLAGLFGPALEPGLQSASRLADAIAGYEGSALLILDDVHVLRDRRAIDALVLLAELLPEGMRLAWAGRTDETIPLARLRASGRLLEIRRDDLAFDAAQVRELAGQHGLELSPALADDLVEATAGWPVAVSLSLPTVLSMDHAGRRVREHILSRSITEYIRDEVFERLSLDDRSCLMRASVLEVINAPQFDSATGHVGDFARVRALSRTSFLIIRLDHVGKIFRLHPLYREYLRHELDARFPGTAEQIAARAARWCHEHGEADMALEYARASGDRALLALLVATHVWPVHWAGQVATMERWISWFDEDGVRERHAAVAVLAAFIYAIDGRRHEAELWLAAAVHTTDQGPMPDGTPEPGPWVAVLRGMMMPAGLEALHEDCRIALQGMRQDSPFWPGVLALHAIEGLLIEAPDAIDRCREARGLSEARGAWPGYAFVTGIEATLTLRLHGREAAWSLIVEGLDKVRAAGLEDYVLAGPLHAVAARTARALDLDAAARRHIAAVNRLRPLMTASTPWLSVLTRLETIRANLAMGDPASARTLMHEVDDILRIRPQLGVLAAEADALRETLRSATDPGSAHWTLTSAELRVLTFLPTHLTFAEIAERLFVSPHTVKSQAVAIYGKLGVSSRREAIEVAVRDGLLDRSALRFPPSGAGAGGTA